MLTVFTLREEHLLKQLWRTNAPLTFTGLLMLPALATAIAGLLLDPRIITDAPAWLKPAKFAVSIAIYVFHPCLGIYPDPRMAQYAPCGRVGHGNHDGA